MSDRPNIPKRLAARIRAVQEKIRQKRLSIIYAEKNYEQSINRVAEFELDPDDFASRYYRNHDQYSYPVQTNIARNRERNAYHERRRDERIRELAEIEAQLVRVEAEVLVEVARMRPTQGRVPWPRKLPAMNQFRDELEVQMQHEDEQWRLARATDDALFERLIAEEEERMARKSAAQDEQMRRDLAAMSPADYARHRAWADYFTVNLKSGKLTMIDVLEILQRNGTKR